MHVDRAWVPLGVTPGRLAPLQDAERRDLLEILEDRHDLTPTIISHQLPICKWYYAMGDPTIADAICDRVINNAHRIELNGQSVRKTKATID